MLLFRDEEHVDRWCAARDWPAVGYSPPNRGGSCDFVDTASELEQGTGPSLRLPVTLP
jgi:hypothetical protein